MKRLSILAAAFTLSLSPSAFAASVDDAAGCKMYSQFGSTMVDFMLPLTLQDFVDMMSGKDTEALAGMSVELISQMDKGDMKTMLALGNEAQIVGRAAGEVAMQILMSGQASSSSEVKTIMRSQCKKIGFTQLIANQKKANQASALNLGQ